MKYNLDKVTSPEVVEALITDAEDEVQVLRNEREDYDIRSKKSSRRASRKASTLTNLNARLAAVQAEVASMEEGMAKNKKLGEIKTLEARIFNLNLPTESTPEAQLVETAFEKAQLTLEISGLEDFLVNLNQRLTEIRA